MCFELKLKTMTQRLLLILVIIATFVPSELAIAGCAAGNEAADRTAIALLEKLADSSRAEPDLNESRGIPESALI